jgi:hypothetical protein
MSDLPNVDGRNSNDGLAALRRARTFFGGGNPEVTPRTSRLGQLAEDLRVLGLQHHEQLARPRPLGQALTQVLSALPGSTTDAAQPAN